MLSAAWASGTVADDGAVSTLKQISFLSITKRLRTLSTFSGSSCVLLYSRSFDSAACVGRYETSRRPAASSSSKSSSSSVLCSRALSRRNRRSLASYCRRTDTTVSCTAASTSSATSSSNDSSISSEELVNDERSFASTASRGATRTPAGDETANGEPAEESSSSDPLERSSVSSRKPRRRGGVATTDKGAVVWPGRAGDRRWIGCVARRNRGGSRAGDGEGVARIPHVSSVRPNRSDGKASGE